MWKKRTPRKEEDTLASVSVRILRDEKKQASTDGWMDESIYESPSSRGMNSARGGFFSELKPAFFPRRVFRFRTRPGMSFYV